MALPILIIGAGMGGLTAALALIDRGFEVEVFEAAPELGDVGAGLTMHPNANRIMDQLGVWARALPLTTRPSSAGSRHWQTGDFLLHTKRDDSLIRKWGHHYTFIHRADLHSALVEEIRSRRPGCLHVDHLFTGYAEDGDRVTARFANGAEVRGRLLVGADGVRSAVREALFGPQPPLYSGKAAWRGLVPMGLVGPEHDEPTSCLWTGPDRMIVRYPVRGGTLMNYVAHCSQGGWPGEGWKELSPVSDVLDAFAGWHQPVLDLIAATPPDLCFKWALYERAPLARWSVGRATLLGDAAHPMQPYIGQGAGMAIEDGAVLARCLAEDADVGRALGRYERLRKPRASFAQHEARVTGDRLLSEPGDRFRNERVRRDQRRVNAMQEYDPLASWL
jgi:salicylate hydroxylase